MYTEKIALNLQRFASIAENFSTPEVLDYVRDRQFPAFKGDELFPSRRVNSLKLDQVYAGNRTPVIAHVAAFDAEAEIGSREANKSALELALIKRKMKLSEEDLIALQNPRTAAEAKYLKDRVYDDIDVLSQGVLAQVEKMSMDALANGKVSVVNPDTGKETSFDYKVPAAHQADLTSKGTAWDDASSDPLKDIENWVDAMDITATRVITSRKIYRLFTQNEKVLKAIYGTSTRALGQADLDAFMEAQGLPVIRSYDDKYREQGATGKYVSKRYFPENKFVLLGDDNPGEKLFGPTPEEIGLAGDPSVQKTAIGNLFATIYTETKDPVGTYEKVTAVALPSFPGASEVFQAQVIK